MVHRWNRYTRNWARRVAGALMNLVAKEAPARIRITAGFREIYIRWPNDANLAHTNALNTLIAMLTTPSYFRGYAPFHRTDDTSVTNMRTYYHISLVYASTPYALPPDNTLIEGEEEVTVIEP